MGIFDKSNYIVIVEVLRNHRRANCVVIVKITKFEVINDNAPNSLISS